MKQSFSILTPLLFAATLFATTLLSSCRAGKEAVDQYRYFDKHLDTLSTLVTELKEPIIHEGDQLDITIMSATLNQEQVAVFNMGKEGQPGNAFYVEADGTINMPVLGKLPVSGKTKPELEKMLLQKLEPYVKNPVVNISFLNFKILMMGELITKGFVVMDNEKATVLDAIGKAGGLTDFGLRENILLIRQLPGGKKEYVRLNLNDARIFASPYFQLQQNDIIYVLPNDSKLITFQRANSPIFRDLPVYTALVTSILAFVAVILTLTR